MKSYQEFKTDLIEKSNDTNLLRIKSLTTQKNHIDDVIKQTKKRQQLQKAYKTISDLNRVPNKKSKSNDKSSTKKST